MKNFYYFLFCLLSMPLFSQITGVVKDDKGETLPAVSIYIDGTYIGTSSNMDGRYELNVNQPGKYTVVFQYLGYKTLKITREIAELPFVINATLYEENIVISEIVINSKVNLADGIIKKAIAARRQNANQIKAFTADFYSKGLGKIIDMPKTFMGQDVRDLGKDVLDSTGTGILYLSETVSKLKFEKPNNLSETIIASKVSGDDKGYSYNTAMGAQFEFYSNTLKFGINMISPIADNAFNYYKYKFEGTFVDAYNNTINKIKVIAKRDSEPVFEGYIYIIDDSWQIYAVDFMTKGYRAKIDMLDEFHVKQNYTYNPKENQWAKHDQNLLIKISFFSIKFEAKFTHVFSNYNFVDSFDNKTFTKEIVKIEKDSNTKDANYWNEFRSIPLADEEILDYKKKDSIYAIRNSEKYLDSIDTKNNRFKYFDLINGYNYRNSKAKTNFNYSGLGGFGSVSFNTVQGFNLGTGFTFTKTHNDFGKFSSINLDLNYGFSDERFRYTLNYFHRFNKQNYNTIAVNGGVKVQQFNDQDPISKFINNISSLFFSNNFMKLYNKEFAQISYSQIVGNTLSLNTNLAIEQRKALKNTTNFKWTKKEDDYSSNNPLDPNDYISDPFEKHHLAKFNLEAKIYFGTKYITRPDAKIISRNSKYPVITLSSTVAFAGSEKQYEYQKVTAGAFYKADLSNFGSLTYNGSIGKFFNADQISFVDFKHFNGNQTHVNLDGSYTNVFNFLPYYTMSTNKSYNESHLEYIDNGFFINKIPLLNLLRGNLVLGAHYLNSENRKPYSEYTVGLDKIGFGKFKIFRIDYIRSYQNGYLGDGVIFGAKFNAFQ